VPSKAFRGNAASAGPTEHNGRARACAIAAALLNYTLRRGTREVDVADADIIRENEYDVGRSSDPESQRQENGNGE